MSVVGLIYLSCFSQKVKEVEVPQIVRDAFSKEYPQVVKVIWDRENENYEASFDLNKVDHSVLIDQEGKVVETEIEIEESELPVRILKYIDMHYPRKRLKEAAKITDAKGNVTYEAEVKGVDLLFDSIGDFIKEVKE